MKKTKIILITVILVVIYVGAYFVLTAPDYTGNFSVNQFEDDMKNENFQTDINYGEITDYKSAAKAGKTAIAERFENANGNLFWWMDCSVQYDGNNDAYYVRAYPVAPFVAGGAYGVILQSDGTVLAIWGEK